MCVATQKTVDSGVVAAYNTMKDVQLERGLQPTAWTMEYRLLRALAHGLEKMSRTLHDAVFRNTQHLKMLQTSLRGFSCIPAPMILARVRPTC